MNTSYYKRNKEAAKYRNTEPSLTDQSQASSTDINIIVTQFLRTGQAPPGAQPVYGDFTEFPTDLRTMFDMARSVREKVDQLPEELRGVPLEELVSMTNAQINAMLPKPATPPEDKEQPK